MKRRDSAGTHLCLTLLLITQLAAAAGGDDARVEYTWPLPLEPALSSTFGETRPPGDAPPSSFHAGIDLKTWGKTGYEVRALADGHVMRVRTSPWGYGRALYQRLDDGHIAVYAHLQAFAEPVAARVEQAQQQSQRYTTDLWLEEDEIIVRKGQVIAWTGKTGAGPPHLHLELRDRDNVPVNPLTHGFQVRDTTPPTIRSIALVPLGAPSSVDGSHQPVTVDLRWDGERQSYRSGASTPIVFGCIGVAVRGHDRADLADNRMAPYRYTLIVDGETILAATYEKFAYSDAFQAGMDRVRLGSQGTYANLFRLPGNRLEFYHSAQPTANLPDAVPPDGLLWCGIRAPASPTDSAVHLEKGRHAVEVVSVDAAGNSRTARLSLVVDAPPRIVNSRVMREKEGDFLEAELRDEDDDLLNVALQISGKGNDWKTLSEYKLAASSGPFTWPLPTAVEMVRLSVEDSIGARAFRTHALGDVLARPSASANSATTSKLVIEQAHFGDFVELKITTDQVLASPPALLWHPFARATGELWQVGLTEYRAIIHFESAASPGSSHNVFAPSGPALPGSGGGSAPAEVDELVVALGAKAAQAGERLLQTVELSVTPVHSGSGATLSFEGGAARLSFPRGSVYETIYPQALAVPAPNPVYRFGPTGVTFNHRVSVALRIPDEIEDPEKMAVYVDHSGEGRWVFAGREYEPGAEEGYVSARVRSFGRQYALRPDRQPPEITQVQPPDGATVRGNNGLELSASIRDEESGIAREDDILMLLNGERLISVYDPDANRVEYSSTSPHQPGVQEFVVIVTDQCGNEARHTSSFTVE